LATPDKELNVLTYRGGGVCGAVSLSPLGRDLGRGLLPENCFIFLSGNGAFWCILGACFNVSIRRVKVKAEGAGTYVGERRWGCIHSGSIIPTSLYCVKFWWLCGNHLICG